MRLVMMRTRKQTKKSVAVPTSLSRFMVEKVRTRSPKGVSDDVDVETVNEGAQANHHARLHSPANLHPRPPVPHAHAPLPQNRRLVVVVAPEPRVHNLVLRRRVRPAQRRLRLDVREPEIFDQAPKTEVVLMVDVAVRLPPREVVAQGGVGRVRDGARVKGGQGCEGGARGKVRRPQVHESRSETRYCRRYDFAAGFCGCVRLSNV
mmetsp:Transcript_22653/g.73663  ORF Transcript_22653/g.73663 Transcript_22653/m.73663 type:complete len:206 (-) Transcript_22653:257-874(-)